MRWSAEALDQRFLLSPTPPARRSATPDLRGRDRLRFGPPGAAARRSSFRRTDLRRGRMARPLDRPAGGRARARALREASQPAPRPVPCASCASRSKRCASTSPALDARARSRGGRVRRRSGPSALRSSETRFCSEPTAAFGGDSPQSSSTRRSVETTSPARRASRASSARCLGRLNSIWRPEISTSSGPSNRTFTVGTCRLYTVLATQYRSRMSRV